MTNSYIVKELGTILADKSQPINVRFEALFTLRNIGGSNSINYIASCFDDSSVLLKHELAYCLGQMQDNYAIEILNAVLKDHNQDSIVRHEAGEALGAIGHKESLPLLIKFSSDCIPEVAETCQLAAQRIQWLFSDNRTEPTSRNPYRSVDPTPPSDITDPECLCRTLLDENQSLYLRYQSLFSLRNIGSDECAKYIAKGLKCPRSALFRHEVAFVLGQLQNPVCVEELKANLSDTAEHPMVRHECAEALGAIATQDCIDVLGQYLKDEERIVRESCVVALGISENENSGNVQFLDNHIRVT